MFASVFFKSVILCSTLCAVYGQSGFNLEYRCDRFRCQYLRPVQIRPFSARLQAPRPSIGPKLSRALAQDSRKQCVNSNCISYFDCPSNARVTPHFCMLENGFTGVCCTGAAAVPKPPLPNRNIRVDQNVIRNAVSNLHVLENELMRRNIMPARNSKEFLHQNFFGSNKETLSESLSAFQVLQAFINYSKRENLSQEDIARSRFDLRKTNFASICGKNPTCSKTRYRTPDGTCNNLINTAQGKAVSTFGRLLPPKYADGINEPRRGQDGGELPNARTISLSISPEANIESNFYSLMLMQFGQFVDHDLTRTAITRTHNDMQISCCDQKVLSNPQLLHPSCFPIPVPPEDTFLRNEQQSCINFVRAAPAINPKCRFGPREQMNQISAYLDGNNIYGSSLKEANKLRELQGGRLLGSFVNNKPFLPLKTNTTNSNCQIPKNSQMKCFESGDIRLNEVTDLVVLHGVFHREHNRIADTLAQLNPGWSDEILYQETKRIMVAQMQHIIYNEMLPLILGPKTMSHFRLGLSAGFSNAYNPIIDSTIMNEFATAAYRLHSLIQGTLNLNTPDNRVAAQTLLRDNFNNPQLLYTEGAMEMRIAGLTGQAIQSFDNFFSQDITNHLFQIPGKRFGLDLVALNIQRGRDHGIPGYIKYREICGLSPITSFAGLKNVFSNPQVADVMSQLYRNIEDVDLFIAGSSEKPLPGAVVGPTFACIIGEQFRRVKEGDRFWYENGNLDTSFTAAQLAEIKKASLARILCDNSDIMIMQLNAMLMPSARNPKLSCLDTSIPRINLRAWKA